MKFEFDEEADAAYLKLSDSQIIDSEEVTPDVVYDYDANDQVVGIEILKLKHKTPEQLKQINFPFSANDRVWLKEVFISLSSALSA